MVDILGICELCNELREVVYEILEDLYGKLLLKVYEVIFKLLLLSECLVDVVYGFFIFFILWKNLKFVV